MTQAHYYGDRVRALLVTAGLIMALTTPFFYDLIPKLSYLSIFGVLVFVVLGGFVSPKHRGVITVSTIVSGVAFIVFQYYAISVFRLAGGFGNVFFMVNEVLAIVCLAATYYGTKSIRGLKQAEGL